MGNCPIFRPNLLVTLEWTRSGINEVTHHMVGISTSNLFRWIFPHRYAAGRLVIKAVFLHPFQRKQVYQGLLASNTFNHRQQQKDSSPLTYFRKTKTEMVLVRPVQER